jgi:hypothetical protein
MSRSEKFIEDLEVLNEKAQTVKFVSYKDGVLRLDIGGTEYGYECDHHTAKEIEDQLENIDDTHTGFSILNPYKKKLKHIFGGKAFAGVTSA